MLVLAAVLISGCAGAAAHRGVISSFAVGDHGRARVNLARQMTQKRGDLLITIDPTLGRKPPIDSNDRLRRFHSIRFRGATTPRIEVLLRSHNTTSRSG